MLYALIISTQKHHSIIRSFDHSIAVKYMKVLGKVNFFENCLFERNFHFLIVQHAQSLFQIKNKYYINKLSIRRV